MQAICLAKIFVEAHRRKAIELISEAHAAGVGLANEPTAAAKRGPDPAWALRC